MSGGVKSNIGHTECAAVMAGMVRFGRRGREGLGGKDKKKFGTYLDLCVSYLRRGHANLLCIVPILSGDLSIVK